MFNLYDKRATDFHPWARKGGDPEDAPFNYNPPRFSTQVGWLKAKDQTILALHKRVITHNARIDVDHEEDRSVGLNDPRPRPMMGSTG